MADFLPIRVYVVSFQVSRIYGLVHYPGGSGFQLEFCGVYGCPGHTGSFALSPEDEREESFFLLFSHSLVGAFTPS